MTKLIHDRPPVVSREKRLNDSGDPLPLHLEATLAARKFLNERLKKNLAKGSVPKQARIIDPHELVKCEKCFTAVKFSNLSRHKRRSCKPKRALTIGKLPETERVQCMYCNQKVANMKAHIKDKHGFLLLPDGTVTILAASPKDPNELPLPKSRVHANTDS